MRCSTLGTTSIKKAIETSCGRLRSVRNKVAISRGRCSKNLPPRSFLVPRNPDSRLNILIRKEVKSFITCSGQKPRQEAFLELENTVRELRAKQAKGRTPSTKDENSRTDRSRESSREENKNADNHGQGCPRRADGCGRKQQGEGTIGGEARSNCDNSVSATQYAKVRSV